jgi:hypothetical protein
MSGNYSKIGCEEAYNQIMGRVGDGTHLPLEYTNGLNNLKSAGDEFMVWKADVDVSSLDPNCIKQVIGKSGCYFIKTTLECDLDFVWHNRETNKFEFWGPKENIGKAVGVINDRINKKEFNCSMDEAYEGFSIETKEADTSQHTCWELRS